MSATNFCRVKKVLREESEDVNRLKDEFLATVSHELRARSTRFMSKVKLLREGRLNQDETARALEIIEQAPARRPHHQRPARRLTHHHGQTAADREAHPAAAAIERVESLRQAADAKGSRSSLF